MTTLKKIEMINGHSDTMSFRNGYDNKHNNNNNNERNDNQSLTNGKQYLNENEFNNEDGNHFLRKIVDIMLNEKCIVGNGDYIRKQNKKLIDFKQPKELESILDLKITENGLDENELLELCKKTIDYSVKTTHPHFYNQLYAGVDQYSLAGSWITEALNTSQATYETSPVFTIMERTLIKYLGSFCGWHEDCIDGLFSPGGSIANIYGLISARYKKYPSSKKTGIRNLGDIVLFVSEDAHYSFVKGAIWMGIGSDAVIKVKTDEYGRMSAVELEKEIIKAKSENRNPFFVGCTAGTTVLGAFDPINVIADVCKKYDCWLHVDAALGGTVLFSKKHRYLLNGIEFADSVTWNLHKLGGIPLQCSLFLTQHNNLLSECNSLNAEYLFQNDKYYDQSYDTGDKSVQCGRKVDSLKLWLALAARGERLTEKLMDNVFDMVDYTVAEIRKRKAFRLVLDKFQCNTVSFWYLPSSLRFINTCDKNNNDNNSINDKNNNNVKDEHYLVITNYAKINPIVPRIKSKMMERGTLMINYQPLTTKCLPNFFRLVFNCVQATNKADIDFLLDEIELIGEQISF